MMCGDCMGEGYIRVSDARPYGSATVYETVWLICHCLENGNCPQCGEEMRDPDPPDAPWECDECGWKENP